MYGGFAFCDCIYWFVGYTRFCGTQVILYWTKSEERVGIVEKVMNDGSIGSTFNEGYISRGWNCLLYWHEYRLSERLQDQSRRKRT